VALSKVLFFYQYLQQVMTTQNIPSDLVRTRNLVVMLTYHNCTASHTECILHCHMPRLFKNTSSENHRFQSTHMHLFVENKFTDFVKSESMSCCVCVVMSLLVVLLETAPLVACETENPFQIGAACLQVVAWSCSAVPGGRLSTRHRRGTSTSQVFRRLHVCRPADTVTDWRQDFLCSRTAAMEQPTDRDPEERHYVRTL